MKRYLILALVRLSLWVYSFRTWARSRVLGEPTWDMAPARGLFAFQLWLLHMASWLRTGTRPTTSKPKG